MPQQYKDYTPPGYYSKQALSIMPEFNVEKVFVAQRELRILCSLQRDPDLEYDSWIGSSEFFKYVNFYFVATVETDLLDFDRSPFGQAAYYPNARVNQLAQGSMSPLDWHRFYQNADARRRNYIYGQQIENMNTIINSRYRARSGFEMYVDDEINISTNHYFEVVVLLDHNWHQPEEGRNKSQLVLYSFCHLDIESLSAEYNLGPFITRLAEYGGPLYCEKLLEKTPGTGTEWLVPEQLEAYFDENGNPYNGIVHYHDGTTKPEGYLGFLSGPKPTDTVANPNAKRIQRRLILNTKVSSNMFIESQVAWDGTRISSTDPDQEGGNSNRFVGFSMSSNMVDTDPRRYVSEYGNLTFGRDLLTSLRAELGLSMLSAANSTFLETDAPNSRYSLYHQKMKHLAITKERGNYLNISSSPPGLSWLQTNSSNDINYSSIFTLNIEKLIKSNSKYGYFLDFHREVLPENMGDLRPHQIASLRFLRDAIQSSKIYCLKIKRKRVTNDPVSNTRLGQPDYMTYDTDEPEEFVIETRTNTVGSPGVETMAFTRNDKAQISVTREMVYDKSGFITIMSLKDYDLFRTKTHGNYKYVLELFMQDGIRKVLELKCQNFESAINEFSKYIDEASIPNVDNEQSEYYVGNQFAAAQDSLSDMPHKFGNYNYFTEQFTPRFIERKEQFRGIVKNLVSQYVDIVYILSQRKNFFDQDLQNRLISHLLPDKADLGNLNFFLDLCVRLEKRLKSMVYLAPPSQFSFLNMGNKVKNVSKDPTYPDKFIYVCGDLNNVITVKSKNSVFRTPAYRPETGNYRRLAGAGGASMAEANGIGFFTIDEQESNTGDPIGVANTYSTRTIDPSLVIGSAINSSVMQTTVNKLENLNGVLSSFGGTFNDLLTSTFSLQPSRTSCGTDKDRQLSPELELAVLDSILTSDDRDTFINEIESNYKEFYFKRARLGKVYDFIISLMENLTASQGVEKSITYAEAVQNDETIETAETNNTTTEDTTSDPTGSEIEEVVYELMSDGSLERKTPSTDATEAASLNSEYAGPTTEDTTTSGTGVYVVEHVSATENHLLSTTEEANNIFVELSTSAAAALDAATGDNSALVAAAAAANGRGFQYIGTNTIGTSTIGNGGPLGAGGSY